MIGAPRSPGTPDLDWCRDAVQGVSRTFALTVEVLDEPMSTHICLGYLLCRVADTVEDAGHIPPAEQSELLRLYGRAIDPDDSTTVSEFRTAVDHRIPAPEERNDDWVVVAHSPTIAATFDELPPDVRRAIVPPVLELVDGMAMFVDRHADEGGLRISDRAELEEYCYYAAGTVGNLITNLLTREEMAEDRVKKLYATAEEFGLLLQLVNVSKDVYDDYTEENNVYLPAEWLEDEGVEQNRVVDPENRASSAAVVERTAGYARSFLDDAQTYLETMPLSNGNTMAAWGIPFLLAVGTLRELGSRPEDAVSDADLKVSRQEVFAVISEMRNGSRASITQLREIISRRPYHLAISSVD